MRYFMARRVHVRYWMTKSVNFNSKSTNFVTFEDAAFIYLYDKADATTVLHHSKYCYHRTKLKFNRMMVSGRVKCLSQYRSALLEYYHEKLPNLIYP